MLKPYYNDEYVTIYHGDCMAMAGELQTVDAIVTDPPYGETSLKWDRWPDGWPSAMKDLSQVMWCFGSLRMFLDKGTDFKDWRLAQDIVWEKHNGSNPFNDRFRRVHENALQFYQGEWAKVHKSPIYRNDATKRTVRRKARPTQWGDIGESSYTSQDGGPRLEKSVIYCRSCHGNADHPTQKPEGIVRPLIEYSVPLGGTVLDPFMGSGTTLLVAKSLNRKAIGIEREERYCEIAARRMRQGVLNLSA